MAVREQGGVAPPYDKVACKKQADPEAQRQDEGDSCSASPVSPIGAPRLMAEMFGEDNRRAELAGEFRRGKLDAGTAAVEKSASHWM